MNQPHTSNAEMLCPVHGTHARPALGKILVVVDPTASVHPCVTKAARIALACGSALELYICDAEEDLAETRETRREEFLVMLEALAAPLRSRGLEVAVKCEWAVPLEQGIGCHVIRTKPDLVVKDTRHHASLHGVVALTDWTLIRQIAAPLLLVQPSAWNERLRITVSADPCRPAERPAALDDSMIALAGVLEAALAANVDVLHVLRPPPHLPGVAVAVDDMRRAHTSARAAVERLIEERSDQDGPLLIHFIEGRVAPTIVNFVDRNRPDILMMGVAARPRFLHTAATGTAAQVLENLKCDVLVMKPPGFVSPLLVTDE